jgi:HSP20 family molecular chaperone IbpA
MEGILKHEGECLIYPGEYTLLPEFKALVEEVKSLHNEETARPIDNMHERKDGFTTGIAVPGARKEDIFVAVNENILSIVVIHRENESLWEDETQHKVPSGKAFEHFILLPDNIDAAFITAWYSQGILNFYIPKATTPSKGNAIRVVVY